MDREFLYGLNPVREVLLTGRRKIFHIYFSGERSRYNELIKLSSSQKVSASFKTRKELSRLCGSDQHQGVVIEVSPYPYVSVEEIIETSYPESEFSNIVLLDGVKDPRNLGAIVRSAHLLGFKGVVIGKHRASPVTPVAVKSSSGATERIMIARETNLARTLDFLRDNGYWVICASEKADKTLDEMEFDFNLVLVMGEEGSGIRLNVKKRCDFEVAIPLQGSRTIGSLNVSVAAGIFMYEIMSYQRRNSQV